MALLGFASSRPDQRGKRALISNIESNGIPGSYGIDPSKGYSGKGIPSDGTTAADSTEFLTKSHDEDADYPPADYGLRAWLFLAGSFWLEGFLWGK
jgi:hypothetical protein